VIDKSDLIPLIQCFLNEDIGEGDHSSLACIPNSNIGKAQLKCKEKGIVAGIELAELIYKIVDKSLIFNQILTDGEEIKNGMIAFYIKGNEQTILKTERLVLNCMQRMSGIATETKRYVDKLVGLHTKVLDTRKTTPGFRALEKWAVKIGGGVNHRFGLYDMIMLKDNHIDYAGGIKPAIEKTKNYLFQLNKNLKIEVEARNLFEVEEILSVGGIQRIMFDNFSIKDTEVGVKMVNGIVETESSGGINLETIRGYAECGVDFISVGAITHHVSSLDLSLKVLL